MLLSVSCEFSERNLQVIRWPTTHKVGYEGTVAPDRTAVQLLFPLLAAIHCSDAISNSVLLRLTLDASASTAADIFA